MLNNVVLIGRLTKDPELAYTQNETAYARFTLAVDRPFTNQQGEKEADFIRILTWGKTAEAVGKNLEKGRLIAVAGRIQVSSFEGQDGQRRYSTEVVGENVRFLDYKKDRNQQQKQSAEGQVPGDDLAGLDIPDEAFPF